MKLLQEENENLSKRLERPSLPSTPEEGLYYSSWIWSAIHIMVSIPSLRSPNVIAEKLGVPESHVKDCLTTLEKMKLVKRIGKHWEHGSASIHIPKESPLVSLHHNNWRQRAVLNSQMKSAQGAQHFTTVTALSRGAREKVKELILRLIDDFSQVSGPSACEELVCLNLDFFEI